MFCELVLLEWLYFQYWYFIHILKSLNSLVQHNKQHTRKVLLSSFQLNGHTIGFHPQTQKLEHLVQHNKRHTRKVLLSSF